MTDDRIVLPLSKVRLAAETSCRENCDWFDRGAATIEAGHYLRHGGHADACLVPLLEQRDRLLTETYVGTVSPDCEVGGAKHLACTGCLCDCHRHSNRGAA